MKPLVFALRLKMSLLALGAHVLIQGENTMIVNGCPVVIEVKHNKANLHLVDDTLTFYVTLSGGFDWDQLSAGVMGRVHRLSSESKKLASRVVASLEAQGFVFKKTGPYDFIVGCGTLLEFSEFPIRGCVLVRVGRSGDFTAYSTYANEWDNSLNRLASLIRDQVVARPVDSGAVESLRKDFNLSKHDFEVSVPEGGGVRVSLTFEDERVAREALTALLEARCLVDA